MGRARHHEKRDAHTLIDLPRPAPPPNRAAFWCSWPGFNNCCENDMPQVAALHALTSRVLALPEASGLLTPAAVTT